MGIGELFTVLVWLICYQDAVWFFLMQPLMIPCVKTVRKVRKNRRRIRYQKGFLNLQQSLMTSLQAGYTLENACRIALDELKEICKEEKDPIIEAFRPVVGGLQLHIPVEKLFFQLAETTDLEEIRQFATVLDIASSTGGNVVEIIRNAMNQLHRKMEAEREIQVVLSGKILEKNIMLLMPFMILLYLRLVNGQYIRVFYSTLGGHLMMSFLLVGTLLCFFWTEHIMEGILVEK